MEMGPSGASAASTTTNTSSDASTSKLTPQQTQAIAMLMANIGKQSPQTGALMPNMQSQAMPTIQALQGGTFINPQRTGQ